MSASILQFSSQSFIALAKGFRICATDEAAGRCLAVSLDLGLAAHERLGLSTRLVKWRVIDDPRYLDHWAVMLDDERVIDLTRVQVDGNVRLVSRLSDYPSNYTEPRIYPAALLMHEYARHGSVGLGRLSSRFMLTCGMNLLHHDLGVALRALDVRLAMSSMRESGRFFGRLALGCLTRALDMRAREPVDRLTAEPDVSSRPSAVARIDQNVFFLRPRHALASITSVHWN
jgi:hypothetical protein